MFLVTEAEADAIRAIFNPRGRAVGRIEVRRLFPGIFAPDTHGAAF
jgi:hypothetical protein